VGYMGPFWGVLLRSGDGIFSFRFFFALAPLALWDTSFFFFFGTLFLGSTGDGHPHSTSSQVKKTTFFLDVPP